jgi:uncharacterized glyoxalase superfamily protein PhnB
MSTEAKVQLCTPMIFVADVQRSADFYKILGFEQLGTHRDPDNVLVWTNMRVGNTDLMLAKASDPADSTVQAVLFYLYTWNLVELRDSLMRYLFRDLVPVLHEKGRIPRY